jgi:hypothetical protein
MFEQLAACGTGRVERDREDRVDYVSGGTL